LYSGDERVSATNDTAEPHSVRFLRQRLIDASQQPGVRGQDRNGILTDEEFMAKKSGMLDRL